MPSLYLPIQSCFTWLYSELFCHGSVGFGSSSVTEESADVCRSSGSLRSVFKSDSVAEPRSGENAIWWRLGSESSFDHLRIGRFFQILRGFFIFSNDSLWSWSGGTVFWTDGWYICETGCVGNCVGGWLPDLWLALLSLRSEFRIGFSGIIPLPITCSATLFKWISQSGDTAKNGHFTGKIKKKTTLINEIRSLLSDQLNSKCQIRQFQNQCWMIILRRLFFIIFTY